MLHRLFLLHVHRARKKSQTLSIVTQTNVYQFLIILIQIFLAQLAIK